MRYGVVLPIWQLALGDAERLARTAYELGFDGVFVPDHIQVRAEAARLGRSSDPALAPRNALVLGSTRKSAGRAAFEGAPEEVAADIRRAQALGADYLVFDLPRASVAAMIATMEQFVSDVKPALA